MLDASEIFKYVFEADVACPQEQDSRGVEAPWEAERGIEDVPKNEKRKILNSNFEKLLNNEDFYKEFKIKSKCL